MSVVKISTGGGMGWNVLVEIDGKNIEGVVGFKLECVGGNTSPVKLTVEIEPDAVEINGQIIEGFTKVASVVALMEKS